MKQLIDQFKLTNIGKAGLYHWVGNDKLAVLGKYEGTVFDGSDRLSMSVMTANEEVAPLYAEHTVIAEGDRFTNKTYLTRFLPFILKIKGDGAAGRKLRGTSQTERQIKSIGTRVSNITPDYEFENSEECYNFLVQYLQGDKTVLDYYKPTKTTLF
jgi:hypothetical protein